MTIVWPLFIQVLRYLCGAHSIKKFNFDKSSTAKCLSRNNVPAVLHNPHTVPRCEITETDISKHEQIKETLCAWLNITRGKLEITFFCNLVRQLC